MEVSVTPTLPSSHGTARLAVVVPVIVVSATLAGCASHHTLPRDLPRLQTVYEQHLSDGAGALDHPDQTLRDARAASDWPLVNGPAALKGATRSAWNEIEHLFAELPNPAIALYIDPHLSEAGYPVPGYTTAFRLYARTEYALPGEVPPPVRPASGATPQG